MQIPAHINIALSTLEATGHEAWLVGGCVRDSLLGQQPHDWDIATAASPNQVQAALAGWQLVDTGSQHGTWTLVLDGQAIQITSFRADGAYLDNRHPASVEFGRSLADDLARRDFTINAIAYHPARGYVDPYGGQADLAAGCLRAVGSAATRLTEDALRILRALRFAANLTAKAPPLGSAKNPAPATTEVQQAQGFQIEPSLAAALHEHRQLLARIAPERIQSELMRMLTGPHILPVLLAYPDVLAVPIPEIAATVGFEQHTKYHCYDVWQHTAHAIALAAPDPLTRLTLLFHDLGKPECFFTDENGVGHFYGHDQAGARIAANRLPALRFDRQTTATVVALIANHQARFKPENVQRWLRRLGEPLMRQLLLVKYGDMAAHSQLDLAERLERLAQCGQRLDELIAQQAVFSLRHLAIGGDQLLALGLRPGPQVGQLLEALLDAVVEEGLPNEPDQLLAKARELLIKDKND